MTIFSTPTDRASRTKATISRGARCEVARIARTGRPLERLLALGPELSLLLGESDPLGLAPAALWES